MSDSGKENLKELLAGFMDEVSAREAAQDIEKGDELFRANPAPQPSEALLAEVRKRMVLAAKRRQVITLRRRIWASAGVAAAIMITMAAAVKLLDRQPIEQIKAKYASTTTNSIWGSDDTTADDPDITVMAAEVESIENELSGVSGVQLVENGDTDGTDIGDLETELIETSGDFWKG
jgi:hypothetical protein